MPVTVVGRILVIRDGIFGKALAPMDAFFLVVLVLQADLDIIFTPAANNVQVTGGVRTGRHDRDFFPKQVIPQPGIY